MAEGLPGQRQRVSGRGAPRGPARPGAGGRLRRWNHGHVRGLSPLQDGVEGCRPSGAGQVGLQLAVAWGSAALGFAPPCHLSSAHPPIANLNVAKEHE